MIGRDDRAQIADGAGVNLGNGGAHARVVAPAETGHDREIFALGLGGRGEDRANTGAVDGDGLLAEDVFSGGHGGTEMLGAEGGRRGEEDDVNAAVEARRTTSTPLSMTF